MVALQSIFSVLAMSLMVNATPVEIVVRGQSVGIVTTFNAAACADPARHQYQVDKDTPSSGHIAAGTCISEATYGSIAVDFIGDGCQCVSFSSQTHQQQNDLMLKPRVLQSRSTIVQLVPILLSMSSLLSAVIASVSAAKLLQPSGELSAPKYLKPTVNFLSGGYRGVAVGVR